MRNELKDALNAISDTCLNDFEDALVWAQWSRELASAVLGYNGRDVDELIEKRLLLRRKRSNA